MAAWETYWVKRPRGTKGDTGNDGTVADTGYWATGTDYNINDRCSHTRAGRGISTYRCLVAHKSGSTTEPEIGALHATYWDIFSEGGADGAGSGDITGPSSSVVNYIPVWASTTGKSLKNSAVNINDVNFYGLTESLAPADRDADFVKIYSVSAGAYRKVHPDKLGRRTESIILTAQGMWPTATSGCLNADYVALTTNHYNISRMGFAHTAKSYAEVEFALPWYYDGGTITARFYWFVPTTSSGSVVWGLGGRAIGDSDNLDQLSGTTKTVVDSTHNTAYDLMITEYTAAITLGGTPSGGKLAMIAIYRDPISTSDTLSETVYLKAIEIQYGCSE